MPADPTDDDNPIEAILLTGFPNPERIGCLSPEMIEALGQKRIARDDPAWHHIWNCSPCFTAFKAIRDRRLADVEHRQAIKKRLQTIILMVAALAFVCLIGFFFVHRSTAALEAAVVPINLWDVQTTRGAENLESEAILAKLPRKLDELHITLPRMSRGGRYIVGILKSKSANTAIALGSAITIEDNNQRFTLVLKLDLSTAEGGRYFLATRLEQGDEVADYYYPVVIESGQSLSQLFSHFNKTHY